MSNRRQKKEELKLYLKTAATYDNLSVLHEMKELVDDTEVLVVKLLWSLLRL